MGWVDQVREEFCSFSSYELVEDMNDLENVYVQTTPCGSFADSCHTPRTIVRQEEPPTTRLARTPHPLGENDRRLALAVNIDADCPWLLFGGEFKIEWL